MPVKSATTSDSPRLQTLSREAFWQHHVRQWRDSGTSKMAYCRQYSLVYHQMVYWCNKQEAAFTEQPVATGPRNGFVPVSVAPSARPLRPGLSLRLPNGSLIEGIDQDNVSLLGDIVQQQRLQHSSSNSSLSSRYRS